APPDTSDERPADVRPDAALATPGQDTAPADPSRAPTDATDPASVGDPTADPNTDPADTVLRDPPAQPDLDAVERAPQADPAAPDPAEDLTVTDGAPRVAPRPTPRPAGFVAPTNETPTNETPANETPASPSPENDDAVATTPDAVPVLPDQTPSDQTAPDQATPDQATPDQTTPDQTTAERANDSPEPATRSLTPQPAQPAQDDPPSPDQARQIDPERAAFPPSGTQLIQLGAFDSPEVARAEWERLVRAHGDLLGTKGPLVQRTVVSGRVFFRLRAEGFANRAEARTTCSALNARGLPCITRVQE
ncbi:MAG: SPOR domain-containing protein, partial [Pseudomonadota bacterium]